MTITTLQSGWFNYIICHLYIYIVVPAAVVSTLVSLILYYKSKADKQAQYPSLDDLIKQMVSLERRLLKVEESTGRPTARDGTSTSGLNNSSNQQESQLESPVALDIDESRGALPAQAAPKEPPLKTFCRLYNDGVDDPQKRALFHERYHITRVSTANATLRRRDPTLRPDFQTSPSGEFFCAPILDGRMHAVAPCFDLVYRDLTHNAGAMSLVFETPNYNPRLSYHRVKVVKPALFELAAGQTWTLREQGTLELGHGEAL